MQEQEKSKYYTPDIEVFKSPIEGWENYTITTEGDIISEPRVVKCSDRNNKAQFRTLKRRYKKPFLVNSGYLVVELKYNNKSTKKLVHRLVAEAFIPNPLNLPEVNHKDCDKSNNKQSNLEWVSKLENAAHAKQNGRRCKRKQLPHQ